MPNEGDPPARRFAATSFAGLFALTAVVLAVLAGVGSDDTETTVYCAAAALLFALLALGTAVERVVVRRRARRADDRADS
ncbi:hypothetical protein ACGF07_20800 [Kitasatospora sp. NPDC048194]|uniref:hypothetical protein n=1 Tax=Kitasatospora sp. NPDC048194 TaxID=3364045 RepID=UPI00371F07BD